MYLKCIVIAKNTNNFNRDIDFDVENDLKLNISAPVSITNKPK